MDQQYLQRAYAKLEKEKKKEKKETTVSKKQERLVIRVSRTKAQERTAKVAILAQRRKEKMQTLRENYEASAIGILEAFGKKIAPLFEEMMAEHRDKLDSAKLVLACSKGNYSGDYAIIALASARSKMTLHRSEIQAITKRVNEARTVIDHTRTVEEPEDAANVAADQLEMFASTPSDAGHYPSDEACDEHEANMAEEADPNDG